MRSAPNPSLYPPSGWVFPISDGHKLSAGSKKELIVKMAYWYATQGIGTDPETDLDAYICSNYPSICRVIAEGDERLPKPEEALAGHRLEYLSRIYRTMSLQKQVNAHEFQTRAETCASCPFRTQVPTGCVPCGDNSDFLRSAIITRFGVVGPEVPVASCQLYGFDLPIACRLVVDSDPKAPGHCWRRPSSSVGTDSPEASVGGSGSDGAPA